FQYDPTMGNITVEKGSITVNGISLTVVNSKVDSFSVAIIPYTIAHTNLKEAQIGSTVNLAFDIVGKYIAKLLATRQSRYRSKPITSFFFTVLNLSGTTLRMTFLRLATVCFLT